MMKAQKQILHYLTNFNMCSFLVVLLAIYSCNVKGQSFTLDSFRIVNNKLYKPKGVEPFTGLLVRYHDNGNKQFEVSYIDGQPEGRYLEWFDNGQLKAELYFQRNGVENGSVREWYHDGTLKIEGFYSKGCQDSIWIYYRSTGLTKSMGSYDNCFKNGEWVYWDDDGLKAKIVIFKNDSIVHEKILIDYPLIEEQK